MTYEAATFVLLVVFAVSIRVSLWAVRREREQLRSALLRVAEKLGGVGRVVCEELSRELLP